MKPLLLLLGLLVLPILAMPAFSSSTEVKLTYTHPSFPPAAFGVDLLRKKAEERLRGKIRVKVIPTIRPITPREMLELIERGEVHIAPIRLYAFTELSKKFEIFELPFIFEDEGAVTRFQKSEPGKALLDMTDIKAYKGLAYWHLGMKQFLANKPLLTPIDAKGLKFGVPTFKDIKIPKITDLKYKALNALTLPIPPREIPIALQKGIIDGVEGTWFSISREALYKQKKYVSVTNHAYAGFVLNANADFWNALPADIRKQLEVIIQEVTTTVNRLAIEESYNSILGINRLEFARLKTLTGSEHYLWSKRMMPVWDKAGGVIGSEYIRAILRSGTGGGGDPCPLGTCRCKNRDCEKECCY